MMPDAVDIGHAIKLPPRQAIRYFQSKGYTTSWNWWETWQDAHAQAFTVAKAARCDVLSSIRSGMARAIAQGQTERDFIKNLEPELKRLGWWGKQVVVDADGGAEMVQLGSPHRLKTIYRTNMTTAQAHGRYRRHLDNADSRPYWQYDAVMDAHTRPSHAAMDGRVFRFDDPIWNTHYPPNDWNCRCHVLALTENEVKDRGLVISSSADALSDVRLEAGTDKRTGEVITVDGTSYTFTGKDRKQHILTPGAGWNYNPGKAKTLFDLERGPGGGALRTLADKQETYRSFGLPRLADTPAGLRLPAPAMLPKAANADAALFQLTYALAIPRTGYRRVVTPDALDDVVVRREYLPHIVEKRRHARERYAHYILPTLQDPLEVWLVRHDDEHYRRRFICMFEETKNQSLVIVEENLDGSLLYNFMQAKAKDMDKQRAGFLLYRKGGQ